MVPIRCAETAELKRPLKAEARTFLMAEHTTYLVLQYGKVWIEVGESEANETMIAQWINEGQFSHPVRIRTALS